MRQSLMRCVEAQLREYPKLKACKRDEQAVLWCRAIEKALKSNPDKLKLVQLRYFDGKTVDEVCRLIPVSYITFYAWRDTMLYEVAIYAIHYGLIEV